MALRFSDYADRDGLGLAELVRRREVKPAELVETALAAIERLNPQLNAVTATMADEAAATLAAGLPPGPFAGVPFLLKDLEPTYAGVPATGGSRFFNGAVHSYDSEIMRRWKRAGLVAVGRTNTPERGSSGSTEPVATGPTHNPWRRGHTPGGSSGGSAAAVAAGIAPAGQAGDAGGSIRGPASCCGLVGLKPTRGRNSLGPDAGEGWHGLVVEHVVTRSVRDSAALLDCTAGYSVGDPHVAPLPARPFRAEIGADPGRLRIGVALSEAGGVRFHPDCAEAVERTATLLADLGHEVEEVSPSYDWEMLGEVVMVFFAASVGRAIEVHAEETGRTPSVESIERNNLWLWQMARETNAVEYARAVRRLNTVTRQFAAFFVDRDIWLTPTMAEPPPVLGHLHADVEDVPEFFRRLWTFNPLNTIYNASGQPAISLPLHWNADGLPIGLMFGAAFGAEDVLLRLAAQLEAARPWHDRHPPISAWNL